MRRKETVYYNKTKEELKHELKQKAKDLGRTPRIKDIENLTLYTNGFGSWNNALIAAGFKPNPRRAPDYANLSEQELIDLVRPQLYPLIKQKEYEKIRKEFNFPSGAYLAVRMGGWNNFLLKAKIPISTTTETDEELIAMYRRLSDKLGYPAKISDLNESDEIPNYSIFNTRFDGINNLRRLAGLPHNESRPMIKDEEIQNALIFVRKKYGEIEYMELIEVLKTEGLPSARTLFIRLKADGIKHLWEIAKELEEQLNICKASDCTNKCSPRKSYCSHTCRHRESGRRRRERRIALGVCLQCGGEKDRPESDHCSECYAYFHKRYKNSTTAKMDT
ncbi:hypothetical protein BK133_11110 [Paenibacillus sp. FSL H8-0548]|uniref:homing endonuclease associated repeat-containing protein n=1 Tax=Paenibacillus sp. FSL H8-0548 TaxID=1920422 RepID=UPI00096CB585|nr:hypothetical protein [Paenibacillus sp. FSL H8-0548]OMF35250.1 hypothetical protein BK133_11110 [Paenibacillus sp. FSL H8-0548]